MYPFDGKNMSFIVKKNIPAYKKQKKQYLSKKKPKKIIKKSSKKPIIKNLLGGFTKVTSLDSKDLKNEISRAIQRSHKDYQKDNLQLFSVYKQIVNGTNLKIVYKYDNKFYCKKLWNPLPSSNALPKFKFNWSHSSNVKKACELCDADNDCWNKNKKFLRNNNNKNSLINLKRVPRMNPLPNHNKQPIIKRQNARYFSKKQIKINKQKSPTKTIKKKTTNLENQNAKYTRKADIKTIPKLKKQQKVQYLNKVTVKRMPKVELRKQKPLFFNINFA